MNLDYNDEQTMLRDQIQKFCESEYDFYKREKIVKSTDDFDPNVWNLFAEQGWLSMPFSEQSGGLGFGPIELSILFEEFGKALVIEPYLSTVVLSGTLLDKSTYSEKNQLIEKICSGEIHISLAYAEAENGYDYLSLNTNLDSKMILNGTKTLVLNGANDTSYTFVNTSSDTTGYTLKYRHRQTFRFDLEMKYKKKFSLGFSYVEVSLLERLFLQYLKVR